jgi:hypothetical protein
MMAPRAHLDLVRQFWEGLLNGRHAPAGSDPLQRREKMSDCLHCEINQLVQDRFERGNTDLVELASMITESLADLILLAPESDRSNLMAHALSAFGQIVLEKSGALDGGSSPTH